MDDADIGFTKADDTPNKIEKLQQKIASIKERKQRLEAYQKQLAESGEDQISLTDPDSRAMHTSTRVGVGYNIQIAVDTKYKLIAEQQVHSKVSDLGLLAETADAARETSVLTTSTSSQIADTTRLTISKIAKQWVLHLLFQNRYVALRPAVGILPSSSSHMRRTQILIPAQITKPCRPNIKPKFAIRYS